MATPPASCDEASTARCHASSMPMRISVSKLLLRREEAKVLTKERNTDVQAFLQHLLCE